MKVILKTTKISSNKIYIPEDVRNKFDLNDGDTIVWSVNNYGELVIEKGTKIPRNEIITY